MLQRLREMLSAEPKTAEPKRTEVRQPSVEPSVGRQGSLEIGRVERCPTMLVDENGEAEIVFTDWQLEIGATPQCLEWKPVGEQIALRPSFFIDRMIVELPTGCVQWQVRLVANLNGTLTMRRSGVGVPAEACINHPTSFRDAG